jgi:hypothetical protein
MQDVFLFVDNALYVDALESFSTEERTWICNTMLMMANHWSCVTLWIAPIDGGATGRGDEYGVEIWHKTSSIWSRN